MKVVIAFASIEGQTAKIARFVEAEARNAGFETRLVNIRDEDANVAFAGVDIVILAASVHERRHPEAFESFLVDARDQLAARPSLLLSVSLSAAFPEGREEAEDYVIELKARTKIDPDAEMLVAGAVRGTQYDYFAQQVIRHVLLRGRDLDPNGAEHEFTDWAALAKGVSAFLGKCRARLPKKMHA